MKQWMKRQKGWNYRLTGVVMLVLGALFVGGLYAVQVNLLRNAQRVGTELASRYAQEEFHSMDAAEALLDLGSRRLAEQAESGADREALEQWTRQFFQDAETMAGLHRLAPMAVIDGALVTAGGTGGAEDWTRWYQEALAADGTVFTRARSDPGEGAWVITVARRCGDTEHVLAFDLLLGDLISGEAAGALPEGSSYYLCDADGRLLYARTRLQATPQELEDYLRRIVEEIRAGRQDSAQAYIYDLSSEKRAVCFNTAENGWLSIITIPYSGLLGDLRQVFLWGVAVCAGLVLLLVTLGVRERLTGRRMARVSETVSALGNSYYAIYRIDAARGTYEAVKSSEFAAGRLPVRGRYDQLLGVIGELIDRETFSQFRESFSLENIRRLAAEKATGFGGDFRRLFGEEYRWVNVRLLFDPSLGESGAILCFRQVEEEKARQLRQLQVLESALDSARQSEAAREQFFSQMSHDMRTPLNVILGTAELARRSGGDRAKVEGCLEKIQVAAGHLLALINDILEMARMEQAGLHLKHDQFDLEETAEQCLSAFQAQAELQGKTLETRFELDTPRVYGDPFRLQQVLNNLVSNALKFTAPGDTVRVEMTQTRQGRHSICRIVVQDTGIGMSEEFLPRLFTPYARENRFGTQNVLGTGLGMTIVKSIVTRMGGQIQVESAPGAGTTFTLTIPMEPVEEAAAPRGPAAPADPAEVLRGKRLLLAEDYEMNLEIATELLQLCGAQVTQARNGREAVEAFGASEPGWFDAVLMDMNMPVMDGCAAAAAIRALDRSDAASVPILAVTANASAEDTAATARAGMNAHIAKPIDLRQLAEALVRLGCA